jgi:hypothetical protein
LNQDVQAIANAMLLDKDQQRYLAMLTLGQCICRSDRFPQPVLLAIPDFPLKKGLVRDEDLRGHMEAYLADLRPENPPKPEARRICGIQTRETLSPLGRIMLENIALEPLLGLVKRFKKLGLKLSHGYKVIEELLSSRLITPLTIDGNRLYELTHQGKDSLGKHVTQKGRGGLEHRYYLEKIKEHYLTNEGFAFVEKDDIDLVVETAGKTMAIQVETGKSDIQANLTKLGRYRADLKCVVATNSETEIGIKETLKEMVIPDREAIQVAFAKDFLRNPPVLQSLPHADRTGVSDADHSTE